MPALLEHANLNVRDIDATVRFLQTAFPEFAIRGGGEANGIRWVHVGTAETYLALNEKPDAEAADGPLNHLGYVVDDVEALSARMLAAGYQEGFRAPSHRHRIRRYFLDPDGVEWEFVEYLSDDVAERNDYSDQPVV